jgi:beta-lactamase regulating signal transducer with metallopeptidase domain
MSPHAIDILAWSLLNFLWQGALVALAAWVACASLRKSRPHARYAVLLGALVLMAVTPAATAAYLWCQPHGAVPAATVVGGLPGARAPLSPPLSSSASSPPPSSPVAADDSEPGTNWLAVLVACWSGTVVLLSLRSLGGWLSVQRLAHRRTAPVAAAVEEAARRLGERLGVRRAVRIVTSVAAEVPGVVGALRPVILLPVSVMTSLTPEQIEQILAHELAHIRRHDYLINLFQTAVENVLFYHPAVWWVSAQMRVEREHCCDDLAVEACGDATAYARTLARLEMLRDVCPGLVLAASGGSLLDRVRRLAGVEHGGRPVPPAWLGALVPVGIVVLSLTSIPTVDVAAAPASEPKSESRPSDGYLAGLTDAGYTHIAVEEIIRLKHHGVEPRYIKRMLATGLGPLGVDQLIRLHVNGVSPEFATSIIGSGLAKGLDVESVIQLRHNGVDGEEMLRIRGLGFGPYSVADVIRLRHNGVDASTFEALKEVGAVSVEDAIQFRQSGVTMHTVREARRQGFSNLTADQLLKLHRAGVI